LLAGTRRRRRPYVFAMSALRPPVVFAGIDMAVPPVFDVKVHAFMHPYMRRAIREVCCGCQYEEFDHDVCQLPVGELQALRCMEKFAELIAHEIPSLRKLLKKDRLTREGYVDFWTKMMTPTPPLPSIRREHVIVLKTFIPVVVIRKCFGCRENSSFAEDHNMCGAPDRIDCCLDEALRLTKLKLREDVCREELCNVISQELGWSRDRRV
jgi:hypothetical protein